MVVKLLEDELGTDLRAPGFPARLAGVATCDAITGGGRRQRLDAQAASASLELGAPRRSVAREHDLVAVAPVLRHLLRELGDRVRRDVGGSDAGGSCMSP